MTISTIASYQYGLVTLGAGSFASSLSITNSGTIVTGPREASIFPLVVAAGPQINKVTLDNAGTIIGGVSFGTPGFLNNSGFIDGGDIGVSLGTFGTIVNSGGIGGLNAISLAAGGVIINSGGIAGRVLGATEIYDTGPFSLIVEPGASFSGPIRDSSGTGQLTLTGTAPGYLNIGQSGPSYFVGFSAISFAAGSDWKLVGDAPDLAAGQVISGLALGDTLRLQNFIATSYSLVSGQGLILSNGTSTETLDITGSLAHLAVVGTSNFAGASDYTDIYLQPDTLISTISGSQYTLISIGASSFASSVSITQTGTVANRAPDVGPDRTAVTGGLRNTPVTLVNSGHIYGGVALPSPAYLDNQGAIEFGFVGVSLSTFGTIVNSGVIDGWTGIALAAGGVIINSGELYSVDGLGPVIEDTGPLSLIVKPGASILGSVRDYSGTGQLTLAGTTPGYLYTGQPFINFDFDGFSNISFAAGSDWTLSGDTAHLASGQVISGFGAGNTMVLDGFAATSDSFVAGTGLILSDGVDTETLDITGTLTSFSVTSPDGTSTQITAPCFTAGTRIATPRGKIPVEELRIGDLVQTMHQGLAPIKWIGTRAYEGRFIAGNRFALPVRIRRHALAFNIPSRDLLVSPDHAICEGGVLIFARNLVNGVSITQADAVERVDYFHIELERHGVIFAENCPAESFIDADCRARFQNAADHDARYPGPANPATPCLPRLEGGFYLHRIRSRIAARAGIRLPKNLGPLRGFIDECSATRIRGWAQHAAAPNEPVHLELRAGGRPIGQILAEAERPDLRAAGLGAGWHGFSVPLAPGLPGPITLHRATDGAPLPYSEAARAAA